MTLKPAEVVLRAPERVAAVVKRVPAVLVVAAVRLAWVVVSSSATTFVSAKKYAVPGTHLRRVSLIPTAVRIGAHPFRVKVA